MDISVDNFYIASQGLFKACDKPNKKPDYISYDRKGRISSIYYYTKDSLIRVSNHWGKVAKCKWTLDSMNRNPTKCYNFNENICAEIKFSELIAI